MNRLSILPAAAVLAFAAACAAPDATVAPDAVPTEPSAAAADRDAAASRAPLYMVTLKDDVRDVRAVARELGMRGNFSVTAIREHAARGFDAVIPPSAMSMVRDDARVAFVEKDGIVTLRLPRETARPGGGTGGQTTPWGITRVGGAGDGSGKTAWIIDTGIDLDHPDLNTSKACHVHYAGTSPDDGNGHGTHVAGTIAALNNATGVVGVAAGAYVCSVRVLGNSGSGSWSGIVNGVNYVAANGGTGDVANMSLGGSGSNATLEKAVSDAAGKGIKFSLAAGNDGMFAGNFTPARVNGANIYTISAISSSGCLASWSNWGNPPVDYAAPGVSILSTWKGGGTKTISGTSMAAPHVAGILLLGGVRTNGFATCDPDGNPDPIASR
jgi:subtilisin family serine protease